ncbi:uncharacterized protein LOC124351030 [Daphnia pulicaria]|uniref:uncharacterized protein LOC124351030 n=1 Tax=Daphnia pulicaria TaxID=35523 RepID=UPI001EEA0486|nr:uncharacterized protein LOC124351030 [Daphnia pulicaria]
MLTRIYDCTTDVDDFEFQGNNLRGGYGTDNKTLLRVVLLHLPPVFNVVRNSSNHIIKLGGVAVQVLLWLSRTMNFKFEIIPDNIYSVENNAAGKGLMSYIVEGVINDKYHVVYVHV